MTTTNNPVGAETHTYTEGMALSNELRAVTPEQIAKLSQELERIEKTHKDYVVPGDAIEMMPDADALTLDMRGDIGNVIFGIRDVAHEQLSAKLQIPRPYYKRMQQDAPELLAENVNEWMNHVTNDDRNYTVRTLDGKVRALLSDRYRTLDNYALLFHTARELKEAGAVITRLDLSEERMFIRAVHPNFAVKIDGAVDDLSGDGKSMFRSVYKTDNGTWQGMDDTGGDYLIPATVTSNSEVGRGGLNVDASVYRVDCRNYIMVGQQLHRVHLGGKRESGLQLSEETQDLQAKGIWSEVSDLIRATFNEELFMSMVRSMNRAVADQLVDPKKATELVVEHYNFTDTDQENITAYLMSGGDNKATEAGTVWGLVNAITRQAHEKPLGDAVRYEKAGGDLLENARELVEVRVR